MNPKIHQAMVNYNQAPSPKFISDVNKDYYYMAVLLSGLYVKWHTLIGCLAVQ